MLTAFFIRSLFMFELKKRQELDYFKYDNENQLPIAYLSDYNTYYVEMRTGRKGTPYRMLFL